MATVTPDLKPLTCCGISSSYIHHDLNILSRWTTFLNISRFRLARQTPAHLHISTEVPPTYIGTFNTNCYLLSYSKAIHPLHQFLCLYPGQVPEVSIQLDSTQASQTSKRDSKQPDELQSQEQPNQSNPNETTDDMAGKLGQPRKGQTFYTQPTSGKSCTTTFRSLYVTDDASQDRYYPSTAGSRGSVSPCTRPPKVTIHNGGGSVPKDEPRSSQVEYDKVYR